MRQAFLGYARSQGFVLDESQFLTVGLGVTTPKFNPPRTNAAGPFFCGCVLDRP